MSRILPYGKKTVKHDLPNGYGILLSSRQNQRMFGPSMKSARDAAGLTLEQAAEAIGISTSQLSRYENEKKFPKLDELQRLAAVYHTTVGSLTGSSAAAYRPPVNCVTTPGYGGSLTTRCY